MSADLADFLTFVRGDAIRALSIICLITLGLVSHSLFVMIGTVVVVLALWADTIQIHRATKTLHAIAKGDRFVAFPANWIESRHCIEIAEAGERMRRDLIEADAAIADQRRMLAESRIRRDGAGFFTTRFHDSVAQAVTSFAQRGNEICATVDNLSTFNAGLLRDAHSVSDAVNGTAEDIQAVSHAASQIAAIVASTSDQIAGSEEATRSVLGDLRLAHEKIERLKRASQEISTIVATIRSVASQTSLLALNATIEAARAGEKGLGFAVVAGEVKILATRSEYATETIRRQIEEIQSAVDETSGTIEAIMARVTSLTATHDAFTASLGQSTAAIESVGSKAGMVAGRVAKAMPNLAFGVGEIETAGRSVLDNARTLMAGSEMLVTSFRNYFEDLTSGSIKVGVLHSLSGTVTAAERPLHDLLIGLIDEANRNGGLLGRPLEAMIINPKNDTKAYAEGARQLIEGGALAIFGCWTSTSRRETTPVVEAGNALLFYPSQYEGGENSKSVFYAGGTPQQQAWPGLDFLAHKGRRRLVLVGHGSIYSIGTHALINTYAPTIGAKVILDLQIAEGQTNLARTVAAIARCEGRDQLAVISTLSGDTSVSFFREMARQEINANRIPILSLSIGEAEMASLDAQSLAGNYVAWNYLQEIKSDSNDAFLSMWRRSANNPKAAANDALAATYVGFTLWTMAVKKAGSTKTNDVRAALQGLSLVAPSGFNISVTSDQHTTLPAFVGQIHPEGRIVPVWTCDSVRYPDGRQQATRPAAAA